MFFKLPLCYGSKDFFKCCWISFSRLCFISIEELGLHVYDVITHANKTVLAIADTTQFSLENDQQLFISLLKDALEHAGTRNLYSILRSLFPTMPLSGVSQFLTDRDEYGQPLLHKPFLYQKYYGFIPVLLEFITAAFSPKSKCENASRLPSFFFMSVGKI